MRRLVVAALLVAAVAAITWWASRHGHRAGAQDQKAAVARSAPSGPLLLRVCADPNNLPFSNDRGEGFENALADLVARDFGWRVDYTWWPQRRGFIRPLREGVCDVVMGVPEEFEAALTTRPYYRSTYVFVTPKDRGLHLSSLEDPRLRRLSIGIHVIGDDYASVPPGAALASRGIIQNVHGYSIYGNYEQPNPPADLIAAVADGAVDVAIAWGPLAGFFAAAGQSRAGRRGRALEITSIAPVKDVALQFAISMGVRQDDTGLRDRLNDLLRRRAGEIDAVLNRFWIPRVGTLP
jgi:quinoprotein dehydrogenase-associated probable ABC transporter substrate-binding protein